jgi:RNA-binding protein Musashi
VFVGGLSPNTTAQKLREYFTQFGPVADAAVLTDPEKRSRGFAFVDFADGIPPSVLDREHFIDERRCGVRKYQYSPSRNGNWA